MNFLNYLWLPALTLILVSCDVFRDEESLFESEDAVTFHFHERDSETNETTVMDSLAVEVPEPLYLDEYPRLDLSSETYDYIRIQPADEIEVGDINLYAFRERSKEDHLSRIVEHIFLGKADSDIRTHERVFSGRHGPISITLFYRPLKPELTDESVSFRYGLHSLDDSVPDSTGILELHPDKHAITEGQLIEVDITDLEWDYNIMEEEGNYHFAKAHVHEKYRRDELHLVSGMVLLRNWGSPFDERNLRDYASPFLREPSPETDRFAYTVHLKYEDGKELKPDLIRFYRFVKKE